MLGDDEGAAAVQLNFLAPCNMCGGQWPQVAKAHRQFCESFGWSGCAFRVGSSHSEVITANCVGCLLHFVIDNIVERHGTASFSCWCFAVQAGDGPVGNAPAEKLLC